MHAPNNHGDGEAPLFIAVVGTGEHEEYKGQQNKPILLGLFPQFIQDEKEIDLALRDPRNKINTPTPTTSVPEE